MMKDFIIKTGAKLIVTDYNHISLNQDDFWMNEYTDNYLVYDKANRFDKSDKIIKRDNLGHNIGDIFHYIYNNYHELPDIMIFCKGDVIPRHCGKEKFDSIINNTTFTPIQNYIREAPKYTNSCYAFVSEDDFYHEKPIEVNSTVSRIHKSKYVFSYQSLLSEIFEDSYVDKYISFGPGGNCIIPKTDALKFNKFFYETMLKFTSWTTIPGESYLLERGLPTIFSSNFKIRKTYKNDNN